MIYTPEQAAEANGMAILTLKELESRFRELGYTLDRTMDCRSMSHYMTGEHAGNSYPTITTSVKEIDTGMRAFHCQARRDDKFKAMQKLRQEVCAIVRGAVLEI